MRRTTLFFAAAAMILSFATASAQVRSFGANKFVLDDANPGVTGATAANTAWVSNITGAGSVLLTTGAVPGSEATPSANTLLDLWSPDIAAVGKALLLTRLSAANITSITTPVAGMIVYDKTNNTIDVNINGTPAGWVAASPSPSGTSANEGIVYNNTSGSFQYRLGASGGAAATTNPFLANRSVNLDAFNLNFSSNGGVLTPFSITGGAAPTINTTGAANINTSGAGATSIGNGTNAITLVGAASINGAAANVGGTTIGNTTNGGQVSINTAGANGISLGTSGSGSIILAPTSTGAITITGNTNNAVSITQVGAGTNPNITVGAGGNNVIVGQTGVITGLGAAATAAHANLDVRGSIAENFVIEPNGTLNYTPTLTDLVIICQNSNAQILNIHLPNTTANGMTPGRLLTIKSAGSPTGGAATYGEIDIDASFNFLDNVAGATAFKLTAGAAHSVQLISDGSNWWIISYQ